MNKLSRAAVAGIALGVGWAVARGDVVTYTVDPTQSSLTITGTYTGNPLQSTEFIGLGNPPMAYSGLNASYVGTLTVNRDATTGGLQITDATISAQNIPETGAFDIPATFGAPAPANYYFLAPFGQSSDPVAITMNAVIRQFVFSLSSPTFGSSGSLDASQIAVNVSSGEVDFGWYGIDLITVPPESFVNYANTPLPEALQLASGKATFNEDDGGSTLTIPIEMDVAVYDILYDPVGSFQGPNLSMHFSGQIVATENVPEPAAIWYGITAVLPLVARKRRKQL